jgi:membrane protease YdiL (CAAX protease family)
VADPTDPPPPPGQQPWPWTPEQPSAWTPPPAPPPDPLPGSGSTPPWTVPYGVPYGTAPPGQDGQRPGRNPLPPPPSSPRMLRRELGLVLLLAFAPSVLGLLFLALDPQGSAEVDAGLAPSVIGIVIQLFLSWSPVLVIGYLLARNREGWPGIGLTRLRPGDLAMGAVLWVASFVVVLVLAWVFQSFGQREVDFLPEDLPLWFQALQAVVIAVTAGFTEEIVVRGYAQTRLEQLRASTAVILLLPTALWAMFHVYQGLGVALTIFGLGLMYAWYFQRTRRLWPLILAHVLFDMTQLVLILSGT